MSLCAVIICLLSFGTISSMAGMSGRFNNEGHASITHYNMEDFSAASMKSPSGHYLSMNMEGIFAEAFSPTTPQVIDVRNKQTSIKVNGKVVCGEGGKLNAQKTYQSGKDGSMWYTNLQVGRAMTAREVEAFKMQKKKVLGETGARDLAETAGSSAEDEKKKCWLRWWLSWW